MISRVMVAMLVGLVALCGTANAFDIVPAVSANDQFVKGWIGFGDPNGGLIGPYGTWNDEDPTSLWATGVRGQFDISESARSVLGGIFGIPDTWWQSLDKVGARAYVFNEIGVCDFGTPDAIASPGIGARLFVLTAEVTYDILDGGTIRAPSGDILAESGFQWFIGVSRVFRF